MIRIDNLHVTFRLRDRRQIAALRGVSLTIAAGETLALIGESGSGKSVLGMAIASLLPPTAVVTGAVVFNNANLLALDEDRLTGLRGSHIGFIPQSAGLALNPTMKVAAQVQEAFNGRRRRGGARQKALELLARLGLNRTIALGYPHQYSGGMRQRALVAIGVAAGPRLVIADEPTKGIDHEKKQEVRQLLSEIRRNDPGAAMLLVTHDLDLARTMADRVAVMYCGQVVETAGAASFFQAPGHPYSRALLAALPENGLHPVAGIAPPIGHVPAGCAFSPRCGQQLPRCPGAAPPAVGDNGTFVSCWCHAQTG